MNNEALREILIKQGKTIRIERDNSKDLVDSKFIKELRNKLGYTELVFASVFDISLRTLKKWENGKTKPNNTIKKLLYLIDKDLTLVDYLYKVTKPKNNDK